MDARPHLEGRALLRRLLSHGIACTYVLLNACSYIMSEVTKVPGTLAHLLLSQMCTAPYRANATQVLLKFKVCRAPCCKQLVFANVHLRHVSMSCFPAPYRGFGLDFVEVSP